MDKFERRGLTIWEPGKTALSVAVVNQHHKQAREYADLIVKAVNAHDELVKALTEVAELTKRQQLPLTAQIHELVTSALAKAS